MAGTPVRILLARHGETEFNVQGRWQGQSDSPLTERGVAQAREMARALADEPVAAVYSSDLGRAMGTAAEVAALHGLQVQADMRLREIDAGLWTGKSLDEIEAEFPGGLQAWRKTPAVSHMPRGETVLDAQTRALGFFSGRMAAHVDQTIVVISHGAVGQAILIDAMGGGVEDLWLKERLDNCQISRLEWSAEAGLKLIEFSDVRHLKDIGSLRGWRTMDVSA